MGSLIDTLSSPFSEKQRLDNSNETIKPEHVILVNVEKVISETVYDI
jgi:hypothetical protein